MIPCPHLFSTHILVQNLNQTEFMEALSTELPIGSCVKILTEFQILLTEFQIRSRYFDITSNWKFCRQNSNFFCSHMTLQFQMMIPF